MSGRLFGYARVSVASDADANNLENQRRLLADCEQVFEDVGSGASWNRPGPNRLKTTLQPGDCVKVAALDRLGRSLTEVLELLDWLRENHVEVISLRESIDQDSAMGRAMLHLAIVFAEMERTVVGLERVKATGKHLGRRKGVSRKWAEEIQNMRQRDGVSWGRIATITGLSDGSICRICTYHLEEIAPTAFQVVGLGLREGTGPFTPFVSQDPGHGQLGMSRTGCSGACCPRTRRQRLPLQKGLGGIGRDRR